MRRIILTITIFAMALTTLGCGGSKTPTCSDSQVTNTVIQIATEQIQNASVSQLIISEWGQSPGTVGNPTYNDLLDYSGDNTEAVQSIVKMVDEQIASLGLSISAIRTSSVDETTKKCECEATIDNKTGDSYPIQYTAQDTDDGDGVYVEVFGL